MIGVRFGRMDWNEEDGDVVEMSDEDFMADLELYFVKICADMVASQNLLAECAKLGEMEELNMLE